MLNRGGVYFTIIFVVLFLFNFTDDLFAQKTSNNILNIKEKKYKSRDYSIDKLQKSHKISKNWAKVYRVSHITKSNSHKRYVQQLKGWECPSYKTFVYLKRKKLY